MEKEEGIRILVSWIVEVRDGDSNGCIKILTVGLVILNKLRINIQILKKTKVIIIYIYDSMIYPTYTIFPSLLLLLYYFVVGWLHVCVVYTWIFIHVPLTHSSS